MEMTGKIAVLWAAKSAAQRDCVLCEIIASSEVREALAARLSLCRSSERQSSENLRPGGSFPTR